MWSSHLFFDGLRVGLARGGVAEAGQDRLQQLGLVVLDCEQEVAARPQQDMGQGPLGEEGVAGEQPDERVVLEQFLEGVLQRLGLGRLAVGDGELSQAKVQLVGEDVEHVDRLAAGVAPLLAGLAVDGRRDGRQWSGDRDDPTREGVAKLLQRALRRGAADRGGVRRHVAGEAERPFEDLPMIRGPALEAGHVGLATEQSEERQGQEGRVRVADPPRLAGVVDPAKGVEQAGDRSSHP